MTEAGTITCKCGEMIGLQIQDGSHFYLMIGNTIVRSIHGICGQCGSEVVWTESDKIIKKILEDAILSNRR